MKSDRVNVGSLERFELMSSPTDLLFAGLWLYGNGKEEENSNRKTAIKIDELKEVSCPSKVRN